MNGRVEQLGYATYSDGLPDPKLYCDGCDDLIGYREKYVKIGNTILCIDCMRKYLYDHSHYNE